MTALVGVFGPAAETSAAAIRDMLGAMQNRASGTPEPFQSSGVLLAAARHDWEASVSGWSGPLVASDEDWVVAADATLYYVGDLKRRLGTAPRNAGSAELILLALHRWGPRFARQVEGDYAIVAYERRRNRVLLARDFGGRRQLAWSLAGRSLVLATSPSAVVRHPNVSAEFDPDFIALSAAGVLAFRSRTAYRHVAVVGGGTTLSFEDGRMTEVDRWTPEPFGSGWESGTSASASEELRALLEEATRERLAPDGLSTVWMSGGWDSTSVFAAGNSSLLKAGPDGRRILPVSMTYPADDTGNEDEHIRAVAGRWGAPVRWVNTDQIPLFNAEYAVRRDDPMPQAFESQLRTLARNSRDLGARVALDGFGGDHIFHVSSGVIVADHVFYGRWSRLWESWRSWGASRHHFVRSCVLPHLSPGLREWIGVVRGRPLLGYWDRSLPPWIIASPGIATGLTPELERLPGEGAAEFEARVAVNSPAVPRAMSWNHALGLDEGVQLRAPLFDPRVISFAVRRPLSDRGGGGDSKRILRSAMSGLIPDSVLAARGRKTGTPAGYFRRQLQASLQAEISAVFGRGQSCLERLGILDRTAYLSAVEHYGVGGVHEIGAILHLTLETERWLVAQEGNL